MRSLTITVSDEMARAIDARIATGAYASESDVVRDGLSTLFLADDGLDDRMCDEVVAVYDRMAADPSRGIPIEDVLARIRTRAPTQT